MPDMLRVAGIPVLVLEDTCFREPDETIGETIRMFAGNLGSTERTPKTVHRCQALFQTAAEGATLQAALLDPGNQVTVGSDLPGSDEITANVRLGRIQPFEHFDAGALAYHFIADLTIRQV